MIKILSVLLFFSGNLFARNFFDITYVNPLKNYSKYSFSYARFISTNIVCGFGYMGYDKKALTVNSVRTYFEFIKNNFSISFKPFYFFNEKDFNFYGGKIGFSFMDRKEEEATTYGIFLSYAKENFLHLREIFVTNFFVEKNFYDEFFIMLGFSLGVLGGGYKGYFDKLELLNLNYFGNYLDIPHFSYNMNFARSFKPDFNSYLYIGFDLLNSSNDLNSYNIGLRTYTDEKESYYVDISFNMADFKRKDNEKIWKIVFGGMFR